MARPFSKEGESLELYFCGHCGTVSALNHRDDHCPVCRTVGNYRKLRVAAYFFDGGEAPFTPEDPE